MADNDDRLRRPEPERTGPNRSFNRIFKNDPWSQRDDFWHQRNGSSNSRQQESDHPHAQSFDEPTGSFDSAAASFANVAQQAVDLAYKISEPYLRAGRQAAESYTVRESGIRDNFEDPFHFKGGDAMNQPYGDPMAQMYGQLARTYAEFMVSLARAAYGGWYPPASPYGAYPRQRDWCGPTDRSRCYPQPPPSYCDAPQSRPHHGERLEIRVTPPPTRSAHISRQQFAYGEQPQLKWLLSTKDPAVKLRLTETHSNGTHIYEIHIDPKQQVGMYTGPIIDAKTDRPIGSVTVEIAERKP